MDNTIKDTCNVFGVNVAITNMDQAVQDIKANIKSLKGQYVCFTNVHTIVTAHENPKYSIVQNVAYKAYPDGKPISLYMNKKLGGEGLAYQVAGPDFMRQIWKATEDTGLSHYFYGSSPETISKLRDVLERDYPNLKIAGMESPPYRQLTTREDIEVVERINKSGADFVWVGLGAPKQEIWMWKHRNKAVGACDKFASTDSSDIVDGSGNPHQVNALMLGVGAGFDFHAGTVKRAPKIIQKLYLEWLYRLLQDPKRLWKRYLKTNLKFLWWGLKG